MCVQEMQGLTARCEAKGIERTVSLFLLQHEPIAVGDLVLVHVGYAIQKIGADDARAAWALYDEMLAAADAAAARPHA
jgi:hydrogenase expression/formation protein HypC